MVYTSIRCVNKILIRLERTVQVVDEKFGEYIKNMKWINFGGGHHITRPDYDIETLIRSITCL